MEFTISFWIAIVVGYIIGVIISIQAIKYYLKTKALKRMMKKDTNIEWYGPDVYMKHKIYENQEELEQIDRDRYIDQEKRRIRNVKQRNGRSNIGSDEANGNRLEHNGTTNENQGT